MPSFVGVYHFDLFSIVPYEAMPVHCFEILGRNAKASEGLLLRRGQSTSGWGRSVGPMPSHKVLDVVPLKGCRVKGIVKKQNDVPRQVGVEITGICALNAFKKPLIPVEAAEILQEVMIHLFRIKGSWVMAYQEMPEMGL